MIESTILKNLTICASNLNESTKNEIERIVTKLGGIFSQNLTKKTSVLISNKINTEKCLVAQKLGIPIVTSDWVKECLKQKNLLNFDDFRLKCFEGVKINLEGFEKEDEAGMIKLIEIYKGQILLGNYYEVDVIVVKQSNILSITGTELTMMTQFDQKIVIEDWVARCIEHKKFEDFKDFKFTHDLFKQRFELIEKSYLKMEKYLVNKSDENKTDVIKGMKMSLLLFNDMIFHISNEFNKQTKEILMKAVSLGRGIVFNKVTPLTTHIICNSTKDNFSNRAMSFGVYFKPNLINPKWVIESLEKKEILAVENYRPISTLDNLMTESNPQLKNEIAINSIVISTIFKNQNFYIYADSYSLEEYAQIKEKIIQHSGDVIELNSTDSQSFIKPRYIIINDGYAPDEMANLIEGKIHNYQFIMSHRFVDLCLEKRNLIDIQLHKYIHTIPFQHPVPFQDFISRSITAFMFGFPYNEYPIMEHFVDTIGGIYELSATTTHIVVKDTIDTKKINYYRQKYNVNIIFVTIDWLLECLIEGKVAKEDKFLIENSLPNKFINSEENLYFIDNLNVNNSVNNLNTGNNNVITFTENSTDTIIANNIENTLPSMLVDDDHSINYTNINY